MINIWALHIYTALYLAVLYTGGITITYYYF